MKSHCLRLAHIAENEITHVRLGGGTHNASPAVRMRSARASFGPGPSYRSGDVAAAMGKRTSQLGPAREALIAKGMIYSPGYGHAAFTVPLFDDFMRRTR